MDYRASCHMSLQLRNKTEFYNRCPNPTQVLSLSIYTSEVSNDFLPIREAWLSTQVKLVFVPSTCSVVF